MLPDSPALGRTVCLGCDPTADPAVDILNIIPCDAHANRVGADDGRVDYLHLAGTAEAGGPDNAAMCDLIHRSKGAVR
jgi:hypothetical protein